MVDMMGVMLLLRVFVLWCKVIFGLVIICCYLINVVFVFVSWVIWGGLLFMVCLRFVNFILRVVFLDWYGFRNLFCFVNRKLCNLVFILIVWLIIVLVLVIMIWVWFIYFFVFVMVVLVLISCVWVVVKLVCFCFKSFFLIFWKVVINFWFLLKNILFCVLFIRWVILFMVFVLLIFWCSVMVGFVILFC